MRLALIVEYEGTRYHGFQYQVNALSIQEELETAIERFTGDKVRVSAAGRTDAGVHARGQVVAFDSASPHPDNTVVQAMNYHLPDDIAVKSARRVSVSFDPRRDAVSRKYVYTILNRRAPSPLARTTAFTVTTPLNVRKMRKAAALLEGSHDFERFSGPLENETLSTYRCISSATVKRAGEFVSFDVEANSFLPHQMRRMAGSLVDVGTGKLGLDQFEDILAGTSEVVARSLPARGLCLVAVTYPETTLEALS